jgi:gliding motility-associated-like protein
VQKRTGIQNQYKLYLSNTPLFLLSAIKYLCIACFIFFSAETGNAQSCTGNLGSPVVNITFGDSANPPKRLPVYPLGNYYSANPCPESTTYTFATSTGGCYAGSWITLAEDHTPADVKGYMMLLNPDSSNLYIDTLHLCGGSTYEFAAFMINLANQLSCGGYATPPNITITIETTNGIVLDSLKTGDIARAPDPIIWNRYSFFFTLPDTYSDVVLRVKNNYPPGGCGNDLAMDDITIRPCGLTLGAAFANPGAVPDTLHFCETDNKTIVFNGIVQSGFTTTTFQWQESRDSGKTWTDIANASNPLQFTKTFTAAGRLQYRLTASAGANITSIGCRTISNTLNILIDAVPVPAASNTSPVCLGSPVAFSAKNGDFYQWSGPAGFTATGPSPGIAVSTLNNNGLYSVVATTIGGCIKKDTTTVIVSDFPMANAGPDTALCSGSSANLQASGGLTYTWTPATGLSGTNIANPVALPAITTNYTVTVSNKYNCIAKDNVLITVNARPVANAGPDVSLCTGSSANLQASGGGQYVWSPATALSNATIANPVATPLQTTAYIIKVTNNLNCTNTDTVLIKVFSKPVANAGPDKTVSTGQSVILNGTAGGDTSSYYWTPSQYISNPNILTPVVSPPNNITYTLHVGSGSLCGIATDDVFVQVNSKLIIPNAFSPNGDGVNDTWNIEALNTFPGAEVKVYNRYGQVVFYSKDYNSKPWDGRVNGNAVQVGTYYYTVDRKKDLPLISGWVVLIR